MFFNKSRRRPREKRKGTDRQPFDLATIMEKFSIDANSIAVAINAVGCDKRNIERYLKKNKI